MYNVTDLNYTTKYSRTSSGAPARNTREYIVLHHTAHGNINATTKNVTDYLAYNSAQVSCHFVVGTQKEPVIYQISGTDKVTWHAGLSSWEGKNYLNWYSIGIEIMSHDGKTFDDRQRGAVHWLVKVLMNNYGIASDKVVTHKLISPGRKNDVGDSFWNDKYSSFYEYRKSFDGPFESEVIEKPSILVKPKASKPTFTDKELELLKLELRVNSYMRDNVDNYELRNIRSQNNDKIRDLIELKT